VAGVVEHLVRAGAVARLSGGLLVAKSRLDQLAAELVATGWEGFAVTDFKARFALSSKWAIPVLEHLAATGRTKREGDAHRVLRGGTPPPEPTTPDLDPGASS
jgi:Elongation factor SelB, winged helix